MKKNIVLFIILIVAVLLRLFRLDANPPSLNWDEASLGYNGFSILTTGHDEHGEFLPLARFIAFGDFKPPGYIYTLVPFIAILGVNEFAIRLPSALSGIGIVFGGYYLAKLLTKNKGIGIITAGLLAISPWSLQLSRAAFEGHLAAFFNLLGIITFLLGLKKKPLLVISGIFFVLSFDTFNSNRITSPLLALLLIVIYRREILQVKKWFILSVIVSFVLFFPNISYLQTRESRLRFQEVSIFTNLDTVKKSNERIARENYSWWAKIVHNRRVYFIREFLGHYLDHFKGEFLFISGDRNPRLSTQQVGEMYLFEAPFLVLGIYLVLKKRSKINALLLGWLFIAPIPAGVARETPHMLRIASILPTFQIFAAIGIYSFFNLLKRKNIKLYNLSFVIFIVIILTSIILYLHHYWIHYPLEWSGEWQYGYKQMVQSVNKYESKYDFIEVTQNYGRPYIYFLLYNRINPLEYVRIRDADRDWYGFWNVYGIGKYKFKNIDDSSAKILRITTKDQIDKIKLLDQIKDPAGNVVFEIGEK